MADLPVFPERITLEVLSPEVVRRLEARDDDVRAEVQQLRREVEGLRKSFYELLEIFADSRTPSKNK